MKAILALIVFLSFVISGLALMDKSNMFKQAVPIDSPPEGK